VPSSSGGQLSGHGHQ